MFTDTRKTKKKEKLKRKRKEKIRDKYKITHATARWLEKN
jgi:hypothetical protein